MLPGAVPTVASRARSHRPALAVPQFLGSYVAVWTLVGLAVYALYRPHGTATAGARTIAAGLYELIPLKRRFRRHCRERSAPDSSSGTPASARASDSSWCCWRWA
jgi:predicted metal-binding membrane protein